MEKKQIFAICSICGSIRMNYERNLWLKKDDEEDFKLYELYMGNSGKRIRLSHTYCPEDFERIIKEYNLDIK